MYTWTLKIGIYSSLCNILMVHEIFSTNYNKYILFHTGFPETKMHVYGCPGELLI